MQLATDITNYIVASTVQKHFHALSKRLYKWCSDDVWRKLSSENQFKVYITLL